MRNLKKAVAVGAVITLLGSTTAVYVSKNDQIQDKINKLYNIAEGYKNKLTTSEGKVDDAQTELNAKKKILADLQTLLGAEGTSYDQLVAGINKKAKTMADTEFQNLINDMVATMHLPTTDADGNPITYDANKLAEEIMVYKDEIDALNDYVNNYAEYNKKSEVYKNMTLLQKLQSMINQLNQASNDAQAQLTLAEAKIVKLGHCPKDEGVLTNGTCAICGDHYENAGTGTDITTGGGKETEQQPSGSGSTGGDNTNTDNTNNNDTQLAELQANVNTKKAEFETSINKLVKSDCQTGSMSDTVKQNLLNGTYSVIDGGGYYHIVDGSGTVKVKLWKNDRAYNVYNAYNAWVTAKQALADYQAQ